MQTFDLNSIQKAIDEYQLNGWLFYDFQGSDPISRSILKITSDPAQNKRWFYFIPAKGVPIKILHSFDLNLLDHLPGRKEVYFGWREIENNLKKCFKEKQKIAIQYSPKNAVPYISRMDAGTYELLKSFKIKPVSSADLVQLFEARLTKAQLNTHINAAKLIYSIKNDSIKFIKNQIKNHLEVNEFIVQKFIMNELVKNGLIFSTKPQVAVGPNSNDPNYLPSESKLRPLYPGQILQYHISAKLKEKKSVYADISWVYYIGDSVPEKIKQIFSTICQARDLAVQTIDKNIKKGNIVKGWRIDELVRKSLAEAGFGSYILHRTGHSVGIDLNANGANIDNLETKEDRALVHGTCFTIEPGIYFSDYGIRTGINVFIDNEGAHVYTQPVQNEIIPLLK